MQTQSQSHHTRTHDLGTASNLSRRPHPSYHTSSTSPKSHLPVHSTTSIGRTTRSPQVHSHAMQAQSQTHRATTRDLETASNLSNPHAPTGRPRPSYQSYRTSTKNPYTTPATCSSTTLAPPQNLQPQEVPSHQTIPTEEGAILQKMQQPKSAELINQEWQALENTKLNPFFTSARRHEHTLFLCQAVDFCEEVTRLPSMAPLRIAMRVHITTTRRACSSNGLHGAHCRETHQALPVQA